MPANDPSLTTVKATQDRLEVGKLLLVSVLIFIACASLMAHEVVGIAAPLWLDESWTGAFASLSSPMDLALEIRDDNNAPAYYALIWLLSRLFGTSDISLHFPGLVLSCMAPSLAWLGLRKSRPQLALIWAAAVGFWGPGIIQSGYARCYPLLLDASVLSCVTYIRFLDQPTQRRRAIAWAASGALVMLTHYFGCLLIGFQGLTWVALQRRRALCHWPVVFVFLPAFCWIGWHAPRLLVYARPEIAWTHPLTLAELPGAISALIGIPQGVLLLAAAALLALEIAIQRSQFSGLDRPVILAGGVALTAATVFIALGCLRPLYTARYLTSFAPGLTLLISSRLVIGSHGRAGVLAVSTGVYAAFMATFWLAPGMFRERVYSYETASAWISEAAPRRLTFFWDNPATMAETHSQLSLVGGFFLRRDGFDVDVVSIVLRPGSDMNDTLLAEDDGRTGFLWLSDTTVHATSARLHPPRLAEAHANLECRDFGDGPISIYACRSRIARSADSVPYRFPAHKNESAMR